MTPFVQQHASYSDRLNKLLEYMKSVAAKGAYDGQKVRELLESFGDELVKTLREEVCVLGLDTWSAVFYPVISGEHDRA